MISGVFILSLTLGAVAPPVVVGGDVFIAHPHPVALGGGVQLVINLEGATCADHAGPRRRKGGRWRLCLGEAAPEVLGAMRVRDAGLANNHARDGTSVADTARALAGIDVRGIPPVTVAARCASTSPCVLAWHDAQMPVKQLLPVVARLAKTDAVLVLAHRSASNDKAWSAALDAIADAGARVVAGSGHHRPGPIRTRGRALIFEDLGDVVFDCACSRSERGLLVEMDPSLQGPVEVTVVEVARGAGGVVGARDRTAAAGRLLQRVNRVDGARIVDGALVIPRRGASPTAPTRPRAPTP